MAIFMTDTHGDFGRLRPAAFREQGDLSKDDCRCRLFGHCRDNRVSKSQAHPADRADLPISLQAGSKGKSGAAPLFPLLLCDKNGKMSQ